MGERLSTGISAEVRTKGSSVDVMSQLKAMIKDFDTFASDFKTLDEDTQAKIAELLDSDVETLTEGGQDDVEAAIDDIQGADDKPEKLLEFLTQLAESKGVKTE